MNRITKPWHMAIILLAIAIFLPIFPIIARPSIAVVQFLSRLLDVRIPGEVGDWINFYAQLLGFLSAAIVAILVFREELINSRRQKWLDCLQEDCLSLITARLLLDLGSQFYTNVDASFREALSIMKNPSVPADEKNGMVAETMTCPWPMPSLNEQEMFKIRVQTDPELQMKLVSSIAMILVEVNSLRSHVKVNDLHLIDSRVGFLVETFSSDLYLYRKKKKDIDSLILQVDETINSIKSEINRFRKALKQN